MGDQSSTDPKGTTPGLRQVRPKRGYAPKLRGRKVPSRVAMALHPASPAPAPVPHADQPEVALRLPLPPSANDYWEIGWHAKKPCLILSKKARGYKTGVAMLHRGVVRALEGRVALELVVHFPKSSRSDVSNRIKVLEDALQGVAYANDRQVGRVVIEEGASTGDEEGFVDVRVRPWTRTENTTRQE